MSLLYAWRVLFGTKPTENGTNGPAEDDTHDEGRKNDPEYIFDVTDEDVRRVFVRVVSHRLRVLDGPAEEILASLLFNATTVTGEDAQWTSGRRTVAEILKEIVDSV